MRALRSPSLRSSRPIVMSRRPSSCIAPAFAATFLNFLGGSVILGVAAAIHIAFVGPPASLPTNPWLYLGGATGVVYIFVSAGLVRHTGVLLLGLGSVVGLLATSVVLDAVWPTDAELDVPRALVAVVVALAAVLVVVLPRQRRR